MSSFSECMMFLQKKLLLNSYTIVVGTPAQSAMYSWVKHAAFRWIVKEVCGMKTSYDCHDSMKDCSSGNCCTSFQTQGKIFCVLISVYRGWKIETVKHSYGEQNLSEIATEVIVQHSFMSTFLEQWCLLNFCINS